MFLRKDQTSIFKTMKGEALTRAFYRYI